MCLENPAKDNYHRPPFSFSDFDDNLNLLFAKISDFETDIIIIGGDFKLPRVSLSPHSSPMRIILPVLLEMIT